MIGLNKFLTWLNFATNGLPYQNTELLTEDHGKTYKWQHCHICQHKRFFLRSCCVRSPLWTIAATSVQFSAKFVSYGYRFLFAKSQSLNSHHNQLGFSLCYRPMWPGTGANLVSRVFSYSSLGLRGTNRRERWEPGNEVIPAISIQQQPSCVRP